jgi:hypothetical protein
MRFLRFLREHLLPPFCHGSSDTIFGISMYGNKHSEKWWFRASLGNYDRFYLKGVDWLYYWFKNRFVTRYHIVNTGLKPGYYDIDEIMFHACFVLLGSFVEDELGKAPFDAPNEYCGYRLHSEGGNDERAIDLWIWYKYQLPELLKDEEADYRAFTSVYGYDYIETMKNDKLVELINIRRNLWT